MKRDEFPNKLIIETLEKHDGLIKHTAKALKISRSTLNVWIYGNKKAVPPIPQDDELVEAVYHARQGFIDDAESELAKNVRDGKETSIIFLLKTLGRERGYVERHEHAEFIEQPLFEDDDFDDQGVFDDDFEDDIGTEIEEKNTSGIDGIIE